MVLTSIYSVYKEMFLTRLMTESKFPCVGLVVSFIYIIPLDCKSTIFTCMLLNNLPYKHLELRCSRYSFKRHHQPRKVKWCICLHVKMAALDLHVNLTCVIFRGRIACSRESLRQVTQRHR